MRRVLVAAVVASLLGVMAFSASAQENLLTNGGLEQNNGEFGPYLGKGRGDLTVPEGWDIWLGQGSTDQFYNRGDQTYAFPHNGFDPSPVEGEWAMNIDGGYVQFNVALLQVVNVEPGANLVAEAKVWVRACDLGEDEIKCASNPDKQAQVKIGIDPNAGRDPNAGSIVWSDWQDPNDAWKDTKVEATATGGQVSVMIFATQGEPSAINEVWIDDVRLYRGGSGGQNAADTEPEAPAEPPTPTPPPFVDFVDPQGARDDGSIVHVVREGDTIDSIAVAYGITRSDIEDLNPNLASIRFIQVGQEILVKEAEPTEEPTPEETEELEPTPTPIPGGIIEGDVEANPDADTDDDDIDFGMDLDDDESVEIAALPDNTDTEPENTESGASGASSSSDGGLFGSLAGAFTGTGSSEADDVPQSPPSSVGTEPDMPPEVDTASAVGTSVEGEEATTPEVTMVPTETPRPAVDITASTASVCVSMFEDANRNRLMDANEGLLAGGSITINLEGAALASYQTDGDNEPHCFTDLEAGEYVALAEAPQGYGLTTSDQLRLPLTSGTSLNIEVGAAEGLEVAAVPPPDTSTELGNSADEVLPAQSEGLADNMLVIGGIVVAALASVMVVAGIGATILLRRAN